MTGCGVAGNGEGWDKKRAHTGAARDVELCTRVRGAFCRRILGHFAGSTVIAPECCESFGWSLTRVHPFFSNEKPGRRTQCSTSGDFGKLISKSLNEPRLVPRAAMRKLALLSLVIVCGYGVLHWLYGKWMQTTRNLGFAYFGLDRCELESRQTWTARSCAARQPWPQQHSPQQHSMHAARQLERRTVISYAYYSPLGNVEGEERERYAQCRSNLEHFLRWGLPLNDGHHLDVILNVIGDSPVPSLGGRRVTIRRRALGPADLFVHAQALRETLGRNDTDYFVFLNCGVRGPYVIPASDPASRLGVASWLEPFTSRLRNGAVISGPSISCERSPHLQSFFVVATKQAAEHFILPRWGVTYDEKQRYIDESEIGLSTAILHAGFRIASLQSWGATFLPSDCARLCRLNPTMKPQDPFELIFLKHGGTQLQNMAEHNLTCKTNLIHVADSVLNHSALDQETLADFARCCENRLFIAW